MKKNSQSSIKKTQNLIYSLSLVTFSLFTSNTIIGQENNNSKPVINQVTTNSIQQSFTITGIVYNKLDNTTLPGASVSIKNSIKGLETDINGKFELKNVKDGDILTFGYLGYQQKEVLIRQSQPFIKVSLEENSFQLCGAVDTKTAYTTKRSVWQRVKAIF